MRKKNKYGLSRGATKYLEGIVSILCHEIYKQDPSVAEGPEQFTDDTLEYIARGWLVMVVDKDTMQWHFEVTADGAAKFNQEQVAMGEPTRLVLEYVQ